MTERVVAPVIPWSTSKGSSRSGDLAGSRVARVLPLAVPPDLPAAPPVDVIYGMGRIDASGRIADRGVTRALGWQIGDRLTLTGTPRKVVARRDPAGMLALGHKPYVAIPAALRARCGLSTGDRVLLAAMPGDDVLTVYPLSTVHQAIRGTVPGEGGDPR
ncbi:AbrB/MazE/SpoVT family DNA-binding domain-containing protein [Kibdelosporangium persicum]|uniref:AbrB family looped-hinge helix DNA binding protein n=1 Tax=Kibdelosporangium persicum TaxID=2698649 RepID=A0ABX2F305_9PSEU|nr:AbrB family looped-hinge helix DNA binding protein [Kibdelosporangium persicum]